MIYFENGTAADDDEVPGVKAERGRIAEWLRERADNAVDDPEGACEARAIASELEGR